jgi:hypothetical protein
MEHTKDAGEGTPIPAYRQLHTHATSRPHLTYRMLHTHMQPAAPTSHTDIYTHTHMQPAGPTSMSRALAAAKSSISSSLVRVV